ncbi:hypothetical protein D6745_05435 [Candidatus Woesearchaeota archaeon]|nr:MAG: hypothetical protein D6745_05435 [Candidatus Woesearchaeota archaeon]
MKIEIDTRNPEEIRKAIKVLSALLEEEKGDGNFSVNEESSSAFGSMFSNDNASAGQRSQDGVGEKKPEKPRIIQY